MNGLQPFEKTIEQSPETMPPSHKTITAPVMTKNRITSLRELLHCRILDQSCLIKINMLKIKMHQLFR